MRAVSRLGISTGRGMSSASVMVCLYGNGQQRGKAMLVLLRWDCLEVEGEVKTAVPSLLKVRMFLMEE